MLKPLKKKCSQFTVEQQHVTDILREMFKDNDECSEPIPEPFSNQLRQNTWQQNSLLSSTQPMINAPQHHETFLPTSFPLKIIANKHIGKKGTYLIVVHSKIQNMKVSPHNKTGQSHVNSYGHTPFREKIRKLINEKPGNHLI